MTPRIITSTAVVGAALMLAVPVAWGNGQPYRDAGDATAAKLALHSSSPVVVVRDAGDATAAKLALQSSPLVVRDAGDATAAKLALQSSSASSSPAAPSTASGRTIHWAQLGIGFGVGMFFVLGLILAVRVSRSHRFAQ